MASIKFSVLWLNVVCRVLHTLSNQTLHERSTVTVTLQQSMTANCFQTWKRLNLIIIIIIIINSVLKTSQTESTIEAGTSHGPHISCCHLRCNYPKQYLYQIKMGLISLVAQCHITGDSPYCYMSNQRWNLIKHHKLMCFTENCSSLGNKRNTLLVTLYATVDFSKHILYKIFLHSIECLLYRGVRCMEASVNGDFTVLPKQCCY